MTRLTICMLLCASLADGAPAYFKSRTFVQPDGSSFEGRLRGDEWLHWIDLGEGAVALYNDASRRYEYAKKGIKNGRPLLEPSGRAAAQGQVPADIERFSAEELGEMWKAAKAAMRYPRH